MSEINYTGNWALDISDMSKEEWDQLVTILELKGVKVYDTQYGPFYNYLSCSRDQNNVLRIDLIGSRVIVSVLQMLNLLETPTKSPTQLKIEELQQTIKQASIHLHELKRLGDE